MTVAWNSSAVLPAMLSSIPDSVPVIVVDNGSDDVDQIRSIAEAHSSSLICNRENVGFGRACNQGAAQAETELILFLNPDATVVGGTFDHLVQASIIYPQASAFNPAIEGPDGGQFFRTSSPIAPRKRRLPKGWPDRDQEVSVLSGAALLVRKMKFDAVGGFDPKIFLYHEDDDLSLRLQEQCGPLMFVRNARVIHDLGNSSETSTRIARMKGKHMGHSFVYASLKHGKPLAFERAVIRAIRRVCSISRLASPPQRAERLGYLSGVFKARHFNPPLTGRLLSWFKKCCSR